MKTGLDLDEPKPPRNQDEAFRAGLRGAPLCNVDDYHLVMMSDGATPPLAKGPTIFVVVDLLGPIQEELLKTTYWPYDDGLELEECYRIGRAYGYSLWLCDLAGLERARAFALLAPLFHLAKREVEEYKSGAGERYGLARFMAHFRSMIDKNAEFRIEEMSPDEIYESMGKYVHRTNAYRSTGPFVSAPALPKQKWTRKK